MFQLCAQRAENFLQEFAKIARSASTRMCLAPHPPTLAKIAQRAPQPPRADQNPRTLVRNSARMGNRWILRAPLVSHVNRDSTKPILPTRLLSVLPVQLIRQQWEKAVNWLQIANTVSTLYPYAAGG